MNKVHIIRIYEILSKKVRFRFHFAALQLCQFSTFPEVILSVEQKAEEFFTKAAFFALMFDNFYQIGTNNQVAETSQKIHKQMKLVLIGQKIRDTSDLGIG